MAKKKSIEELTCCDASQQMLEICAEKGIETVFDRAADMRPCPIGAAGICCKNCAMGPGDRACYDARSALRLVGI